MVWSELTEENPGCSSGIAHQPEGRQTHTVSGGLRARVDVFQHIKTRQKPLDATTG